VSEQVENFVADIFEFESEVHEDLSGNAFLFPQQPEQQMLGTDVVMIQVAGFIHRIFDHLLGAGSLREFAHGDHIRSGLDNFFDFDADFAEIDIEVFQDVGGNARAFLDESQQDVFGADVFMIESLGFLIGQLHDLAGAICETLVHDAFLSNLRSNVFRSAGRKSRRDVLKGATL